MGKDCKCHSRIDKTTPHVGTLEAHKNGFLYTSRRGERIKILYNNVK